MWIAPVQLEGPSLVLRPAKLDDAEGLFEACDPAVFRHYVTLQPKEWTLQAFKDYLGRRVSLDRQVSFVAVDRASGRLMGETSFMDIREEGKGLEIGLTWWTQSARGTQVNPEAKALMLQHAFEAKGAIRVTLKTDALNLHSQAAIRKLGAQEEGTLRRHGFRADGSIRDTVYFGITDLDWPEVKERLWSRLGWTV